MSTTADGRYPPLSGYGDYALIGDCRTAALVSRTEDVDWLCLPSFSASAVFSALLETVHALYGPSWALRCRPPKASKRYLVIALLALLEGRLFR